MILVVENEELVRDLVCRTLRRGGYSVLVAEDGEEALRVSGAFPGAIDLMVTDVIMVLRPGLRILFVSGYADDATETSGILGPGMEYLQKRFTPSTLLDRVREMLITDRARS